MNTERYTCLEIFAKAKAEGGKISLVSGKGEKMEKEASPVFYTWMKFSVEQNTEYEIESDTCEVTLCYLSGNEDMLETGVRYLEKERGGEAYVISRDITICFTSLTLMGRNGPICTGGMRPARIWYIGCICPSP